MKMTYISTTILAHFLTDNLNWLVLWVTEKYLSNNLYDKPKKNFLKTNVNSKEFVSSKAKQTN